MQDVSHELRSPLARLRVALEIARKKGPGPIQSEIDRIGLESDRLETLVNDVLGLLRETSEATAALDEDMDLAACLGLDDGDEVMGRDEFDDGTEACSSVQLFIHTATAVDIVMVKTGG